MARSQSKIAKTPITHPASFTATVLDEICFVLQFIHKVVVIIGIIKYSMHANIDFLMSFAAMSIISLVVVHILFMPFRLRKGNNVYVLGNGNRVINGKFFYTK